MHKGIYLKALLELSVSGSQPPAAPDHADHKAAVTKAVNAVAPAWTAQSKLSHELKRVRVESKPSAPDQSEPEQSDANSQNDSTVKNALGALSGLFGKSDKDSHQASHASQADQRDKDTRNNQSGQTVSVLAYLEGDQDAPLNFSKLATEEWRKLLEQATQQLAAKGIRAAITQIEEDSDAVDELADEADS